MEGYFTYDLTSTISVVNISSDTSFVFTKINHYTLLDDLNENNNYVYVCNCQLFDENNVILEYKMDYYNVHLKTSPLYPFKTPQPVFRTIAVPIPDMVLSVESEMTEQVVYAATSEIACQHTKLQLYYTDLSHEASARMYLVMLLHERIRNT